MEAHRLAAILRGTYSGPYSSVRERLQAAWGAPAVLSPSGAEPCPTLEASVEPPEKPYKNKIATDQEGFLASGSSVTAQTAIRKLLQR
jgi:hypothetical protein